MMVVVVVVMMNSALQAESNLISWKVLLHQMIWPPVQLGGGVGN